MNKPVSKTASAAVSILTFIIVFAVFFGIFIFVGEIRQTTLQAIAFLLVFPSLMGGFAAYGVRKVYGDEKISEFSEKPVFYPLCGLGLTFAVLFVAFTFTGVWPFGNRTVMVVDLYHQYTPLLEQFTEIIANGRSLLYSFRIGLGASLIPLAGYYLASPFNLLLLLFPPQYIAEGIYLIVLLKLSLAGMAFTACIQYITKRRSPIFPLAGAAYACMMYSLAYFWNVMWLDAVMMLPVVIMLFTRMTRTGKWGLYSLSLAYILFTNYYIGFMVCIFMVLWFIAYVIGEEHSFKKVMADGVRFAAGSLFAGCMAAFMLIPVFLSLGNTSAAGQELPFIGSELNVMTVLQQMLWNPVPTIRSGNPPNLYCGLFCAIALPLYLGCSKIPVRRKISRMFLLGILAFSMSLNIPNLVWHGLHTPNDLPYRFSFLFSFVVVLMAGEVFTHWRTLKAKSIGLSAGFWAVIAILCEVTIGAEIWVTYLTLIMLGVHAAVFCAMAVQKDPVKKRLGGWVCMTAVLFELCASSIGGIAIVNGCEVMTNHNLYVASETSEALRMTVEAMKRESDDIFFRMETLPRLTCVDTALFDYPGITTFASSNSYATTKFMEKMGFACNGVNSYMYRSTVKLTDDIFGVKYAALLDTASQPTDYEPVGTVEYHGYPFTIYENTDALSIGFAVNADLMNIPSQSNPFSFQNSFICRATGVLGNVYENLESKIAQGSEGVAKARSGNGYFIDSDGETQVAVFTVTVPAGKKGYCYADFYGAKSVSVSGNSQEWGMTVWEPYVISFPESEYDEHYDVTVTVESAVSGKIYAATLNEEIYAEAIDYLKSTGIELTSFRDSRITGTFTAKEPGVLFTSIPYDEGWEVLIDGEKAETEGLCDAFLTAKISAGTHTVEMKYFTPGLRIGLIISGISVLLFAGLMIIGLLIRKRTEKIREKEDNLKLLGIIPSDEEASEKQPDVLPEPDDIHKTPGKEEIYAEDNSSGL